MCILAVVLEMWDLVGNRVCVLEATMYGTVVPVVLDMAVSRVCVVEAVVPMEAWHGLQQGVPLCGSSYAVWCCGDDVRRHSWQHGVSGRGGSVRASMVLVRGEMVISR